MKQLTENVKNYLTNSSYISDKPDKPKECIYIYVESEDDVPFWHRIFKKYASGLIFRINPATRNEANGKEIVLDLVCKADATFLLCIDSDYDYLLGEAAGEKYRNISKSGKEDFVFETYTYSIENYKCYAYSMDDLCVRASLNDEYLFDFVTFLRDYSESVYELFLYSIYFEKNKDTQSFCREELGKCVNLIDVISSVNDFNAVNLINSLKERVQNKKEEINNLINLNDLESIRNDLEQKSVNKHNVYLFIQGHVIFDKVVLSVLKKVVNEIKDKKRKEIKNKYKRPEQMLQQYKNKIKISHLETLLYHNIDYDSCFLMKKIEEDIEVYRKKYWPNKT